MPAPIGSSAASPQAGQAVGARVGDALYIGDYSLLWASVMAWVGMGIAIVTSGLAVRKPEPPEQGGQIRPRGE